jgi:hypothetical protein
MRNNCYNCHGMDGRGAAWGSACAAQQLFFTQRLADVGWSGSLKDYIALTVAAGRPSNVNMQWAQMMPTWSNRFGGPLRDGQVDAVTAYVLNWEKSALTQGTEDNPDPWQFFANAPTRPWRGQKAPQPKPLVAEPTGPRQPQELFVRYGVAVAVTIWTSRSRRQPRAGGAQYGQSA